MPGRSRSLTLHSPGTQGWLLVAGLAFALFGGFCVWNQSRQIFHYRPVEAVVQTSKVHERWEDNSTLYSPEIEYEYVVDGRTRRSDRVFALDTSNSFRWWAQGWVDRYPVGRRTRAYHDPAHPERAFLVRKAGFFPYIFLLLGQFLVCSAFSLERARIDFGVGRRQIRIGPTEMGLFLAALALAHYAYLWLLTRGD